MNPLAESLKAAARNVNSEIAKELRAQGHYLTGALEASLKADVTDEEATGSAYQYLIKLSEGVPANQIQFNAQALAEMTRYVQLRMGYQGTKAARVAALILQKQQQEGNPTKGSFAFSANGRRKGAIEYGFRAAEKGVDNRLSSGIVKYLDEGSENENENETV